MVLPRIKLTPFGEAATRRLKKADRTFAAIWKGGKTYASWRRAQGYKMRCHLWRTVHQATAVTRSTLCATTHQHDVNYSSEHGVATSAGPACRYGAAAMHRRSFSKLRQCTARARPARNGAARRGSTLGQMDNRAAHLKQLTWRIPSCHLTS